VNRDHKLKIAELAVPREIRPRPIVTDSATELPLVADERANGDQRQAVPAGCRFLVRSERGALAYSRLYRKH